ncbi:MAG: sugar phosphate nucleotidyltransferase [Gemmatimonadota bacterium]
MWGIIPAAGSGTRIQPLAFSKELLPVGSRLEQGIERPRAVSEYLVERMLHAGASHICFIISAGKSDILEYYGARIQGAAVCYVVQQRPRGLCDALFAALPFLPEDDDVLIGLPDTVWFPENGLAQLPGGELSFLLFPVDRPEFFDAVVTDESGQVLRIEVKEPAPSTNWIWGAFRMPARTLRDLHRLWLERQRRDEYIGSLVNAWLGFGNRASGIPAGDSYVDTGTLHGYREAIQLLSERSAAAV